MANSSFGKLPPGSSPSTLPADSSGVKELPASDGHADHTHHGTSDGGSRAVDALLNGQRAASSSRSQLGEDEASAGMHSASSQHAAQPQLAEQQRWVMQLRSVDDGDLIEGMIQEANAFVVVDASEDSGNEPSAATDVHSAQRRAHIATEHTHHHAAAPAHQRAAAAERRQNAAQIEPEVELLQTPAYQAVSRRRRHGSLSEEHAGAGTALLAAALAADDSPSLAHQHDSTRQPALPQATARPSAALLPPPAEKCDIYGVLARAIVPVLKVCKEAGLHLTLCSPKLISNVNKSLRRAGAAALQRAGPAGDSAALTLDADQAAAAPPRRNRLLAAVAASLANGVLSLVLDASMQRIGSGGCVSVDVCYSDNAPSGHRSDSQAGDSHGARMAVPPPAICVTVSDTGCAAAPRLTQWMTERDVRAIDLAQGLSQHRRHGDAALHEGGGHQPSAEDALHRMHAGLPVGDGSLNLRNADSQLQRCGGSLSVRQGKSPSAVWQARMGTQRWLHTTVSFPVA